MIGTYKVMPVVDVVGAIDTRSRFQLRDRDFHIILDTCSIKRIPLTRERTVLFNHQFNDGTPYFFVLTQGVCEEAADLPELPWYLNQFVQAIASEVINPNALTRNRNLIQRANLFSSSRDGKPASPMGDNDLQIVNYALERAEQGLQTLVVSDDTHIARSINILREKRYVRENIFRIGLRYLVPKLYPHINPYSFPHIVN